MNTVNAELTTESTMSHYGIPVLRINGVDYGPRDIVAQYTELLEDGAPTKDMTAAEFVCVNCLPAHCFALQIEAAEAFCAQWPEGPQPKEHAMKMMFGDSK